MIPPPQNHMRTVAPVHMLSNDDGDLQFDNSHEHEPDLEAISEEHEARDDGGLAQRRLSSPYDSNNSTDESDATYTSLSDIIDGLPTAVKRLGPLRTMRRSAGIRSWVSYFYEISTSSMGAQLSHEEHTEEHHRRTLVDMQQQQRQQRQQHEQLQQQQHQHQQHQQHQHPPQPMNSRRRRASNAMRGVKGQQPSSTELVEYVEPERKGIDTFCGMQGQLLVNNALSERRSSFGQDRADGDHLNERRAYVQGLAWLLQGLPQDLDDHERADLLRAMPPSLLGEKDRATGPHGGGGGGARRRRIAGAHPPSSSSYRTRDGVGDGYGYDVDGDDNDNDADADAAHGREDRSFVQRVVAALIVQLLVVPVQCLWAYMAALLGHALYLERKYKVTEHVVRQSGELGYRVGRNGVRLSGVIYHNGGARVGAVLTDTMAYVADGVVKGIGDGIKEACLDLREDGYR